MIGWIQLVGPRETVEIFGVRLVGFNAENGRKLLFSIVFIAAALILGRAAACGDGTAAAHALQ